MSQVYLDGKLVDSDLITPEEHKFVGLFRPAQCPDTKYIDEYGNVKFAAVFVCGCGQHLWTKESVFSHYSQGHMDTPQYCSIKDASENLT